jgi:hypothetical protein
VNGIEIRYNYILELKLKGRKLFRDIGLEGSVVLKCILSMMLSF